MASNSALEVPWGTRAEYPRHASISKVFRNRALAEPDSLALIAPTTGTQQGTSFVSYGELDRRAALLAMRLREQGVGAGDLVGMFMERSIEAMVAMLGTLMAGAAYAPLDPSYPPARLQSMIDDARPRVLLTNQHLERGLPKHNAKVIPLPSEWGSDSCEEPERFDDGMGPEDPAYVMFTSGSTGRPKGVVVPHRGVLRLVLGADYVAFGRDQVFLQLAPLSFDATTFEVWGALLHGSPCVLFPGFGAPDPRTLGEIIKQHGVTVLWLTSSLFNTIIDESPDVLAGLKTLLTGGEALSVPHVRKALRAIPETQLVNGYGPTEGTTFTCCYPIPPHLNPKLSSIPIGRPIANTEVHILNDRMEPVPFGQEGELYIGGDGLALGYVNRADLTAQHFVTHPFSDDSSARLYKSGDVVRSLPEGVIEFVGRQDSQVKIRGYRIEIGEIEECLKELDSVGNAVVVALSDKSGTKRLVAYLTAGSNQNVQVDLIARDLRERLPPFMVPAAFVYLEHLPLTPNGKIDYDALPEPAFTSETRMVVGPSPRTDTERRLARLWCELLDLKRVSTDDNFFDVGGTSLVCIRILARLRKTLGSDLDLSLVDLFKYPTVAALAKFIDRRHDEGNSLKVFRDRGYRQGRTLVNESFVANRGSLVI